MRALTLSAIVGGLILAGVIVTVHSCNSSNPKPDVAKPPSVGVSSGHDSGTVDKTPKPEPNTVYPSVPPKPQPQLHQQTPTPKPSSTTKPKLDSSQDRSRVNCYVVRIPVSSGSSVPSSPPTITPIHCN